MSFEIASKASSFQVRDCAFISIATGHKARSLIELRDLVKIIPAESLYYHFWRQTIETSLAPGSYYNDFSHWAHYDLHDDFLAERLTWINPTEYHDLEKLRAAMLLIIEKRIVELGEAIVLEVLPFYFVNSNIVIFNTKYKLETPMDLVKMIPRLSKSSIFYHFIDARIRQSSKKDDFTVWLKRYGEEFTSLIERFEAIDPYFISLSDLQQKLLTTVTEYFI